MKYQDTTDITISRPNTNSPTASVWRRKFAKLIVVRASVGCMTRPASIDQLEFDGYHGPGTYGHAVALRGFEAPGAHGLHGRLVERGVTAALAEGHFLGPTVLADQHA